MQYGGMDKSNECYAGHVLQVTDLILTLYKQAEPWAFKVTLCNNCLLFCYKQFLMNQ